MYAERQDNAQRLRMPMHPRIASTLDLGRPINHRHPIGDLPMGTLRSIEYPTVAPSMPE